MKTLKRFCAAVIVSLMIAFSTFAGDILGPGAIPPPPPPQSSVTGEISFPGATATGDIGMPGVNGAGEISGPGVAALDPVTEAALSLLQSILSFF